MSEPEVSAFDYVILSVILLISILIGLYHGYRKKLKTRLTVIFSRKKISKVISVELNEVRKANSRKTADDNNDDAANQLSDYLTASSSMGVLPLSFSLLATFFSSTTIIGTPAEVYQYGIQNWIITFGFSIIPPTFAALVTGPFFAKLNILSVFEYIELRYESKSVRLFGMSCYVLRNFISSAVFTLGPSTALSLLMGLDQNYSIALIIAIGTFYTCIGGIKAVIWTDLFQAIIMFTSVAIIVIKGTVFDVDGFSNLWSLNDKGGRLNFFDFNPDPFIRQSFWTLIIGGTMNFSMYYCFDQQSIQRFKAAKTTRTAQIALLLNTPGIILIMSLCSFCGLITYAAFHDCDPLFLGDTQNANQYFTFYVLNYFYALPGVIGLFLGAVFCSALSSLSSYLNSLVAIIWEDFLQMFEYFRKFNDTKSLTVNKLLVLFCGVIVAFLTYIVALSGNNLVQLSASLNSIFNGPLVGLFVMSMFFSVSNKYGAIGGFGIGLCMTAWLSFGAFVVTPVYPKLNVSIADQSCFNRSRFFNTTNSAEISFANEESHLTGFDKFYSLSYMLYSTFGFLNTIISGLLISIASGGLRNRVNKSLLVVDLSKFIKIN